MRERKKKESIQADKVDESKKVDAKESTSDTTKEEKTENKE